MDPEMLKALVQKYLEGKATPGETDQLNAWYNSFDPQKDLYAPDQPDLDQVIAKNFSALKGKLGLE